MEPVQIVLTVVVVTFTVLIGVIGFQDLLILRDLRKSVKRLNSILEDSVLGGGLIKPGKLFGFMELTKKGKKLKDLGEFLDITEEEEKIILDEFKKYRTAELHDFSSVRAMTGKNQWNHLQREERLLADILDKLYKKVTSEVEANVNSHGLPNSTDVL